MKKVSKEQSFRRGALAVAACGISGLIFIFAIILNGCNAEKTSLPSEASSQARKQAKYIVDMQTHWYVAAEDVEITEGGRKTSLWLASDSGGQMVNWILEPRQHHFPYKAMWNELIEGSYVQFEFREDPFYGTETYDYLIPRLELGSPRYTF